MTARALAQVRLRAQAETARAYIELSDWDSGNRLGQVSFPFNPEKFSITTSGSWSPPSDGGAVQYLGAQPRTMTIGIFLDAQAKPDADVDVVRDVDILVTACYPTNPSDKNSKAPRAKFGWDRVHIDGYVENVNVEYLMFTPTGLPVRAECTVTIKEVAGSLPGQNPTSGTRRIHRTVETIVGDTLPRVAYKELGDPARWRSIAELNGIDDPMTVRPGTRLLVPARGETEGG
ncbi:MAG TPA: peptidase M23 [Actinomycetota bacterium]|nr:peptidase M23 [Actinomycetota bacterium]